jgi:hypothetical protein
MMNSDAVSIIDSLHAKERELNQEKVCFIQFLSHYNSCLIISPLFAQASLQLQVQELQNRIHDLQASQLKGGEEVEERVLQLQTQLEQILKSEAETRAALQQETANLATTLEMNSDAISFIESLKLSLKTLEEVRLPTTVAHVSLRPPKTSVSVNLCFRSAFQSSASACKAKWTPRSPKWPS